MAITTVVRDGFFERLLPVLRGLDRDPLTGPLTFAMLVPSSVDSDFRYLVLASPGLDELGLARATEVVLRKLREGLGEEALRISSASIRRTDDRAIRTLAEAYDIPQLGVAYQALGAPATTFDLDHPILFVSRHLAAAA